MPGGLAWISNEVPDVRGGGGQRRQYHQLRALLASGVRVTTLVLENGQDDASVRELAPVLRFRGPRLRGYLPAFELQAILRRLSPGRAIVAHVDSHRVAGRALRRAGIPYAVDFQNVLSRGHGDEGGDAAEERRVLAQAGAAFAVSEEEAAVLRARTADPGRVAVAPQGVEPEEWPEPPPVAGRPPVAAVFGTLHHPPSRAAAAWMAGAVWPLVRREVAGAELHVMGPGEPPAEALGQPGVVVRGRVERLAEALAAVRVVAVPVTWGVGSRVKFIEGLASGTPVVSTSIGAEGFPAATGTYLAADDPAAFAAACIRLMVDDAEAERLGASGRRLALSRYTWQQSSRPLVDFALGNH